VSTYVANPFRVETKYPNCLSQGFKANPGLELANTFGVKTLPSSGKDTTNRNRLDLGAHRLLRWDNYFYAGFTSFLQSSEQGIDRQATFGGGIGRYLKNPNRAKISLLGGCLLT